MNARIHFLGTGAAMPIKRSLPCIVIKVNSDLYVLDPGEGCQYRMFKRGLSPLKIKAIFISHGHGDHYLGMPGLIQTMTLSERKDQLMIAFPTSLKQSLQNFVLSGLIKPCFKLELAEVNSSFTYADQKIQAKAFPVDHGVEAYGYWFSIGKKTICYSGDTAPTQSVVENCRGVDILIHEATFTNVYEKEAYEQKHSTAGSAARTAALSGAKMLILVHMSARHENGEIFFDAYRFYRNTVVANDEMIVIL
ncbi:MAG: ribonuclease Z [Desulfurococcaceae archaeon]